MYGSFPGSPDHNYYVADNYFGAFIEGNLRRCPRFDTEEEAIKELNKEKQKMNKEDKKDLIKLIKNLDILSWGIKEREHQKGWWDISLSGKNVN